MAASAAAPPDPTTSPWLSIAGPIGQIAGYFFVAGCFVHLFAPLAFLLALSATVDPATSGGPFFVLISDPVRLLSIGDFVMALGGVILTVSLFLVLFGLIRADRPVRFEAFLLGALTFACVAAWAPVMLYAQTRAHGSLTSIDSAAAIGGWGLASVLMLVASLTYLFFTMRLENGTRKLGLPSFKWPIYGAMNVLGTAALAGFFAGGSVDAFSLGLVLKVTLIPMLGVMAFSDLRDRFPSWARVPLNEETPTEVPTSVPTLMGAQPVAAGPMTAVGVPPPPPED